jgi:predicted DNA binding CopG/RHH family protein
MALNNDEIIKLIEAGATNSIKLARRRAEKINMHLTGQGVKQYLEMLDGYETYAQKLLREKLVKSNRSLFSFILRPTDKIFTAKGGSINYNLPTETISFVKNKISDVADGLDIKKYLKKVVKSQYVIDPNGILFIDIDNSGMLETHIINSSKILYYANKGNKVNALIFEPYKKDLNKADELRFSSLADGSLQKEKDKKYYRVIDEMHDMLYVNDGGVIREVVEERMDNYFVFVPAIILGDEKDPNNDVFESVIADLVEDADAFLRRVSVTNVHELAHLYPRYWSYEQACTKCEGEGTVNYLVTEAVGTTPAVYDTVTCSSCGGDGSKTRTNPSDEMVLRTPMEGEPVIAPNVAGYVQPDLQTANFYAELIEQSKNTMFQAMWGTTYQQGGKRETATGRFLDAQPVQDRLRDISDTFAKLHKFALDCYVKVLIKDPRYESSVSYGNRYILESPDDILDKYMEASREKISEVATIDIRNRYFEAEYQNDAIGLSNRKKLSNIEPFPSLSANDVALMDFITPKEKMRKVYFSSWIGTLTAAEIVFSSEEELTLKLNNYINQFEIVKPETNEGTQVS